MHRGVREELGLDLENGGHRGELRLGEVDHSEDGQLAREWGYCQYHCPTQGSPTLPWPGVGS